MRNVKRSSYVRKWLTYVLSLSMTLEEIEYAAHNSIGHPFIHHCQWILDVTPSKYLLSPNMISPVPRLCHCLIERLDSLYTSRKHLRFALLGNKFHFLRVIWSVSSNLRDLFYSLLGLGTIVVCISSAPSSNWRGSSWKKFRGDGRATGELKRINVK